MASSSMVTAIVLRTLGGQVVTDIPSIAWRLPSPKGNLGSDVLRVPIHIERILDLARWAPSGDNTQPWRFEVLGDEHVLVHGYDTRDHVVYDRDGRASQLALGGLLETMVIAASGEGRLAEIQRRQDMPETRMLFDVRFRREVGLAVDPLLHSIEKRVVQRRPMSTRSLTGEQKRVLEQALPDGYVVNWYEGLGQRWRLARFMFDNAKIRLTIPEAYQVHNTVIEWGARYSEDRIPEQAVGVDPMTAKFMHWVMHSWARVEFFNTWLFGHLPPRIQLDLLPGMFCAAHLALLSNRVLCTIDDYVAAGRGMQRFWLSASAQGLYLQPEMTPVIFTRYARSGVEFSHRLTALATARDLDRELGEILGPTDKERLFFMARVGWGPAPVSRSTRLPLAKLWSGH